MPAHSASFQGLGDLPGGTFSSVSMAVSADGKVAVGYSSSASGNQAFRWTATSGMVGLGDLPGGIFSSCATGVSADGAVVVGYSRSSFGDEAFRWTQDTGMVGLGDLPGGSFGSSAWGISADGQVIVGYSSSESSGTGDEGFRWTASEGMVALGDLPGGNFHSRAMAVSADGSVIVGVSSSSNSTGEAYCWTAGTGMVPLGDFPGGGYNSAAYAVSGDGLTVAGRGYSGVFDPYTHEALRWTAASGLVELGFLPCSDWSIAHAVSRDGSVLVGDPESNQGDCAFIWDSRNGMRSLHEVLVSEYGLDLTGWQLSGARGISADGGTIVGFGINPSGQCEAWIAAGLVTEKPIPALTISKTDGHLSLSWASSGPDFVLQSSDRLLSGWADVVATVFTNGNCFTVAQES